MRAFVAVLLTVASLDLSASSPFWASARKSDCACASSDPSPCVDCKLPPPLPPPQCRSCAGHRHSRPCPPIVTKVPTPGRIIVKEAPQVVAEYVEGKPLVLKQEAAPRFVFGDTCPIRLTHHSKPITIEHFETPYIIDAFQKSNFINHAAKPVVIDHYEAPAVVRDEGLPPVYQPCECEAPCPCGNGGPCPCGNDGPCH